MLLIDIGNTRIKWAFWHNDQLVNASVADHASFAEQFEKEIASNGNTPASAWVCSVGLKKTLKAVQAEVEKAFGLKCHHVTVTKQACGLTNDYNNLSNLGVDRWVAAIGARTLEKEGDLIVIDVGTAVTIDWVSNANVFEGGAILPGQQLMHDSLVGQTANIRSELLDNHQIIGKDTKECVNSGTGYGVVGAIERIVYEMQKLMKTPSKIIITGGGMSAVTSRTSFQLVEQPIQQLLIIEQPGLVLLGLARIASEA